jgi:hypothetical protein
LPRGSFRDPEKSRGAVSRRFDPEIVASLQLTKEKRADEREADKREADERETDEKEIDEKEKRRR